MSIPTEDQIQHFSQLNFILMHSPPPSSNPSPFTVMHPVSLLHIFYFYLFLKDLITIFVSVIPKIRDHTKFRYVTKQFIFCSVSSAVVILVALLFIITKTSY
jgi:uncharacterized membrane protein YqhA